MSDDAYLGRCRTCKQIVGAVSEDCKDCAKHVAAFIRDGYVLDRVAAQAVRETKGSEWGCSCAKQGRGKR